MDANESCREARISRRKLLINAGWAVPVIVGLTLPRDALAQYRVPDLPDLPDRPDLPDLPELPELPFGKRRKRGARRQRRARKGRNGRDG